MKVSYPAPARCGTAGLTGAVHHVVIEGKGSSIRFLLLLRTHAPPHTGRFHVLLRTHAPPHASSSVRVKKPAKPEESPAPTGFISLGLRLPVSGLGTRVLLYTGKVRSWLCTCPLNTMSTPYLYLPSVPRQHHVGTTSAPRQHHASTTSAPRQHHVSTTPVCPAEHNARAVFAPAGGRLASGWRQPSRLWLACRTRTRPHVHVGLQYVWRA